jgi:hypothetical protein
VSAALQPLRARHHVPRSPGASQYTTTEQSTSVAHAVHVEASFQAAKLQLALHVRVWRFESQWRRRMRIWLCASLQVMFSRCALKPELPAGLSQVVMRALHHQPEQRFANVGALIEALQPFTVPAVEVTPPSAALVAPAPRGRRWLVAVAAAVAVLGLGVLALRWAGSQEPAAPEPALVRPKPPDPVVRREPDSLQPTAAEEDLPRAEAPPQEPAATSPGKPSAGAPPPAAASNTNAPSPEGRQPPAAESMNKPSPEGRQPSAAASANKPSAEGPSRAAASVAKPSPAAPQPSAASANKSSKPKPPARDNPPRAPKPRPNLESL